MTLTNETGARGRRAAAARLAALLATACDDATTAVATAVTETNDAAATAAETIDPRATGLLAEPMTAVAAALASGETTSETLTRAYLDRIERVDRSGPTLRSVLAVNPDALDAARASDARRKAGEALGPLDGVPILIKDNIETLDPMATTAGALALAENVVERDAPLVAGLRAAGVVILGKTNLSQWANFRSEHSMSGWSALGGQTRNPYALDRNPCGSSSGSGVAIAASLAAAAIGTETNGSITCPSRVNGLVGFKPTVGVVGQDGVIPISASQDTAGPMTKTVADAAALMNAMQTQEPRTDFVAALEGASLDGARIGVMRFAQGEHPGVRPIFDAALQALEAAGAVLVDIDDHKTPDGFWPKSFLVLKYEFKAGLDAYLADAAPAVEARSLADVIAFNRDNADVELSLFGQDILEASEGLGGLDAQEYLDARAFVQKATREDGSDRLLAEADVDALVAPSGAPASRIDPVNGDVWASGGGAGWMAAVAGYPHVTVPIGTFRGLPVGISFMAGAGADADVLRIGHAFEQVFDARLPPAYLETIEDLPEIAGAMAPAQ
ncbi:MAG: amidase [Parvularculaceae bacterium]